MGAVGGMVIWNPFLAQERGIYLRIPAPCTSDKNIFWGIAHISSNSLAPMFLCLTWLRGSMSAGRGEGWEECVQRVSWSRLNWGEKPGELRVRILSQWEAGEGMT